MSELDMVISQLTRIENKQDEEIKCRTNMKLQIQQLQNDSKKNERTTMGTQKIILDHIKNKEKHYQPYYSESLPQKVWRKKGELTVAGGILFLIERLISIYLGGA